MTARQPIRVLVVDDSAAVRAAFREVIDTDPGLTLFAAVPDAFAAVEKMRAALPDVVVLDVELPKIDGITFLRRIMAQRPLPVVICSSHTTEGSEALMRALEAGAVDVIEKPSMVTREAFRASASAICETLRAAASARVKNGPGRAPPQEPASVVPKLSADAVLPPLAAAQRAAAMARIPRTEPVICIGASTGGTEALRDVLTALPPEAPGVVIVQHMPQGFTAAFSQRLDGLCAVRVKEAADGDSVERGRVLIAPGNRHMALVRRGSRYSVSVFDGPAVSRHRPSVDVLFRSAAQAAGTNAVAAILTGMGDDGANGLLEMRQMGGTTIAQDEASCVVFGMPKEAIARGGAMLVLPLARIPAALLAARAVVGTSERRAN